MVDVRVEGNVIGGNVNIGGEQYIHQLTINNYHNIQKEQPQQISVFLSYARADDDPDYDDATKSFMRRLYNALVDAGFAVWWDRASLPSRGEKFTKEIETAIRTCERFVLVVGPGAIGSPYVRAEWEFAASQCKPITPILRAGEFGIIPAAVADINTIDCRTSREEIKAFGDLIKRLNQDAPLGDLYAVKALPKGYITRSEPFNHARDALCADAINPTVISAQPGGIALYGMGGIGKSTMAVALAYDCQVRRHYPDGVLWIEVGQNPTPIALQAAIGVMLGDQHDNYQDEHLALLSLSRKLQEKSALIVLDVVWNHTIVGKFPVNGTSCRLLITTRSRQLASMVNGADIPLSKLADEEGAALIAAIIGSADDEGFKQITRELGGHTLAIALAAAQIKNRYVKDADDLLRLLKKRASGEKPFSDLNIDETDKDQNLALSLSLSYDSLNSADLQRRFRQVGIFTLESTFDRVALAAIWGDADEDDARTPIRILEGVGLLDAEENGRYSQHRLLHVYARAMLRKEGEIESSFTRYADYVIAQAKQFDELAPEDWEQLKPLLPHVDSVGDALSERFDAQGANNASLQIQMSDFAYNITNYVLKRPQAILTQQGIRLRGLNWLENGLSASRAQNDEKREPVLLSNIGTVWSALGEQRKALDFYEQALPILHAVGDHAGEATTLNNIGSVWSELGEKRRALDFFEQALPLRRTVGDRAGEAATLNNIGTVWSELGEQHKALDFFEQALPILWAVGDRAGEANTLNNIGMVWSALGEQRKTLDFFEQALPLKRAVGDRAGEATTLNNIGMVWSALGEQRRALDFYEQALPIQRAVGDRTGEATTLNNIGMVWSALGEQRKTLDFFEQALPFLRAVGNRAGEAATLNNIGAVWSALGEQRKALDFYKQALPILRAVGDHAGEADATNKIAYAWFALGEKRKALDFYEQALPILRAVGNRAGEAKTLNNIGTVWSDLGEQRKALDFYEQALPLQRAVGDRASEATTLTNISMVWSALGEQRKALDLYEQVLPLLRSVGNRAGEADATNKIAYAWFALGEKRKALDFFEQALPLQRAVGDRAGEAVTCYNIGMMYYALGELDKVIEYIERGVLLNEEIGHPDLESDRQKLEALKAQRGSQQNK